MSKANLATPAYHTSTHGCAFCALLARCRDERLWLDVLPCEALLDFEVGIGYEKDSSPSYWVMPLQVRVNPQGGWPLRATPLAKPCVEVMG